MHRFSLASMLVALLVVPPAEAQQGGPAPQRVYKCVDSKGKVYYTQIPPPQCLGRETQVLNKSGTVLRTDKPHTILTPDQKRTEEEARKAKLQADEQAREERRKNLALLNTYPSARDIDDARARALREAQAAIGETEKHIADAKKRRQALEGEKEFYQKKPLPAKLKQSIANAEIEIKNQTALLEAKKKEISTINARYDEDKRRYLELTAGKAGADAKK